MIIVVKPTQSLNTSFSIVTRFAPAGNLTLDKTEHPSNALALITSRLASVSSCPEET